MPSLPPFPFKSAPNPEVPPLPPAIMVRQPEFSITYQAFGDNACYAATLHWDQMPVMDRDPQAVPDIPGGGYSYLGQGLEYVDMGIAPLNRVPLVWSGIGAQSWTVYVDGIATAAVVAGYDGDVGPFSAYLGAGFDWSAPHTYFIRSNYADRPGYREFYIDPTSVGVIAFGCGGSVFWNQAGYWDPWVNVHHSVASLTGPVDRHGSSLGLTGPWGASVPQQHVRSDDAPPCFDAYACTLIDFVCEVDYADVTYTVETIPVTLPRCKPTDYPIFRHRHKIAPTDGAAAVVSGDPTHFTFQQTHGFKAS